MVESGRVIMVSGAARGMGAAIARKFHDEGCDVPPGNVTILK